MKDLTVKTVFRYILIILIIATLLFIFSNSLKSQEESSEDSAAVGGFLESIIPPDTELGEFVQDNVRKIAHFTEFAILGGLVALYVVLYTKRLKVFLPLSLGFGFLMGFVDESLQYFSSRGPSIMDVWIDFFGFLSVSASVYLVTLIVALIIKKRRGEDG